MSDKPSIPEAKNRRATPIGSLPEDQDKLHATLEERIYNIVGTELLEKNYKPSAYAEAILQSAGEEQKVNYLYAKIRYKELYTAASRRLKHTNDLKG